MSVRAVENGAVTSSTDDLGTFEQHRARLHALAYRMLGDVARAEDIVQEAWLRWQARTSEVDSPRAFLVTIVTRLCLNELESARARREQSRGDRLPEPIDLDAGGLGRLEALEEVSMAFLVVLQRLTPAERAVLLLRDIFDFDYAPIAALVGKSEAACRKLLERARAHVVAEKRLFATSADEHRRLLGAFMQAASSGDTGALAALLAEDAVLITDGGRDGRRVGGLRNLPAPLRGADRIAAFIVAATARANAAASVRDLNGQAALVIRGEDGAPVAALLLGVADGRIHRVFFHADRTRLGALG